MQTSCQHRTGYTVKIIEKVPYADKACSETTRTTVFACWKINDSLTGNTKLENRCSWIGEFSKVIQTYTGQVFREMKSYALQYLETQKSQQLKKVPCEEVPTNKILNVRSFDY